MCELFFALFIELAGYLVNDLFLGIMGFVHSGNTQTFCFTDWLGVV